MNLLRNLIVPAASFSLHPHPHPGGTRVSAFEWKRTGLKRHSTCENHAYAATQLVRKRQRANQQASGSRSPQRSPTVQSRRADARGILEAEEGGEVLAHSLSLSLPLLAYSSSQSLPSLPPFLFFFFFLHPFSRSSLALRSRTLIFFNLLFLGKRFRSRFFSIRKTAESRRQKIAGTPRITTQTLRAARSQREEEEREPKPAS